MEVYPTIPSGATNNIRQVRNYIRDRLAYCDTQITGGVPGTGVTLSASELSLTTGSATLSATVLPSNTTDDVLWWSSDTTVATVEDGLVTPVSDGACTINAKCGSGYASCEVTVAAEEPDDPTPTYTNLVPISTDADGSIYNGTGYMDDYRLGSSGSVSAMADATHTGFMPAKKGDVIRIKIIGGFAQSGSGNYINFYNAARSLIKYDYPEGWAGGYYGDTETLPDGSVLITGYTANHDNKIDTMAYFRVSLNPARGENLIVTVNEKIED